MVYNASIALANCFDHIKLIGCRGAEFAPAGNKIAAQFIGLQQWMPPFA